VVAEGADGDWIVFSREERYFVPWINWQSFGRITVETHVSLINLKVHPTLHSRLMMIEGDIREVTGNFRGGRSACAWFFHRGGRRLIYKDLPQSSSTGNSSTRSSAV
jgi:hypothetical protein